MLDHMNMTSFVVEACHQAAGFRIVVPGIGSGNWEAANCRFDGDDNALAMIGSGGTLTNVGG